MLVAPEIPHKMYKKASIGKTFKRFLVGRKDLASKDLSKVRESVTDTGWAHLDPNKGFLRSIFTGSGKSGLGTIKGRFAQGGVFGRGGILRGDLAWNPQSWEVIRKLNRGQATGADVRSLGKTLPFDLLNTGIVAGMPLAAAYHVAKADDMSAGERAGTLGGELGTVAGYALGGPFGMIASLGGGILAGTAGEAAGRSAGKMFEPSAEKAPVRVRLPGQSKIDALARSGYLKNVPLPGQNVT